MCAVIVEALAVAALATIVTDSTTAHVATRASLSAVAVATA